MKPGDLVTWFRAKNPQSLVPGVFVDQIGKSARIRINDRGTPRTVLVRPEFLEPRRETKTDGHSLRFADPGFRGRA